MSQNAKQSSLQLRRLATPPFFFALVACAAAVCVVCVASALFCVPFSVFKSPLVHLASNGCNRWEMKLAGELYMLWKHVDGSP